MHHTICIRDELILEADAPHILLRRAGEPSVVRIYLNEVRYLADALCSMAAEMAGMGGTTSGASCGVCPARLGDDVKPLVDTIYHLFSYAPPPERIHSHPPTQLSLHGA